MPENQSIEVKVGQVWKDRDPRKPNRLVKVIAIEDGKVQVEADGKPSKVSKDRMRPIGNTKGFELVEDVGA